VLYFVHSVPEFFEYLIGQISDSKIVTEGKFEVTVTSAACSYLIRLHDKVALTFHSNDMHVNYAKFTLLHGDAWVFAQTMNNLRHRLS
jgi:hypothetical protein